jgi:hypothetical protein
MSLDSIIDTDNTILITGTGIGDSIEFTYEDCVSYDLLNVLWEQYNGDDERISIPVSRDDLLHIQRFSRYVAHNEIEYKTATPFSDTIEVQLGDTWYNLFFSDMTIAQCQSLYKTCEYVGVICLLPIIARHSAYILNTNDIDNDTLLSLV